MKKLTKKEKIICLISVIISVIVIISSCLLYKTLESPTQSVSITKNYDDKGKYIGYSKTITKTSFPDSSECKFEQDKEK